MISKAEIEELVDRNLAIGKHTDRADVRAIRLFYREIFNDNYKEYEVQRRRRYDISTVCHTCIVEMLDALRVYVNYPTLVNVVPVKLSDSRIAICKACRYVKGKGVLMTCGKPIVGETVPEGKLCGCFVRAKAKFPSLYCPLGYWDEITAG